MSISSCASCGEVDLGNVAKHYSGSHSSSLEDSLSHDLNWFNSRWLQSFQSVRLLGGKSGGPAVFWNCPSKKSCLQEFLHSENIESDMFFTDAFHVEEMFERKFLVVCVVLSSGIVAPGDDALGDDERSHRLSPGLR
jgi:hypothetical protein